MIHEENGQIIVDELRPMRDAPRVPVMVLTKYAKTELFFAERSRDFYRNRTWILFELPHPVHESELIGFIPVPIYLLKDGA